MYHLWYHAVNGSGNLPTDIYHAQSLDLLHWAVTATPALQHSGRGFEYDQVAGGVPLAAGGRAYMCSPSPPSSTPPPPPLPTSRGDFL